MTSVEKVKRVNGISFSVSEKYDVTTSRTLYRDSHSKVIISAIDSETNNSVIIKKLLNYADDSYNARNILRNIRTLKLLNLHPNVRLDIRNNPHYRITDIMLTRL
jgi:hypothetical protein